MSDGDKVRNWAYLLLRGQETIAEREGVKGKLRGAGKKYKVKYWKLNPERSILLFDKPLDEPSCAKSK